MRNLTNRRLLLIIGCLVGSFAVALGVALWMLQEPEPPVDYVPYAKIGLIKEGMALAEVERILGRLGTLDSIHPLPGQKDLQHWMIWQVGDRHWAVMGFHEGRVRTGTSWRIYMRDETTFEKIGRWLRLG